VVITSITETILAATRDVKVLAVTMPGAERCKAVVVVGAIRKICDTRNLILSPQGREFRSSALMRGSP
jgi:hypothetical protein